jgi:hypothetical protein
MFADNTNENWSCPQELDRPLPRPVRLTGIGIFYCVMALASIIFGVVLTAQLCIPELRRQAENDSLTRRLTAEGSETEATVTRLWSGMGIHKICYNYTVGSLSNEKCANITSEHWQSLEVGSSLTVRYLPSDPAKVYPDSDPPNSQNNWPLILPALSLVLGFPLLFAVTYSSFVWPQFRLLARGKPARGVVTRCKEGSRRRMSGYFWYYYFPLADGGQCQGKDFSRQPAAEGSNVTVLYDPNKPRRNDLYPLETVRLAANSNAY